MMILRDLSDPRLTGMPSVTRVKVTADLGFADVYVTVMGTPGQRSAALNALKHSAGLMRSRLTKDLQMRQAPYLRFHYDEELKKELEVMELLDRVARENAELDRKRAEAAGEAAAEAPGEAAGTGDATASAQPAAEAPADAPGDPPARPPGDTPEEPT